MRFFLRIALIFLIQSSCNRAEAIRYSTTGFQIGSPLGIGPSRKDSTTRFKFSLPNSIIAGFGMALRPTRRFFANDTDLIALACVELGFGWHNYRTGSTARRNPWILYGAGITLEYRFAFYDDNYYSSPEDPAVRHLFMNTTAEYAFGIEGFGKPLGLHFSLSYTTDFVRHYYKPSIGWSMRRTQCGAYRMALIGSARQNLAIWGIFARFIITRKNQK